MGGTGEPASIFESDDLRIDLEKRRVFVGNNEIHLTPIEYRILQSMVSHADRIVTHRMLLREVWGTAYGEEVHQLRVHMANLRRKLEREPARPRHIVTEQAVGYRLVTHD